MEHAENSSLDLAVPAKINLFLKVGPKSADGYHPLASWMVTVGLFDRLRLTVGRDESESGRGAGPEGGVPMPARPEGPGGVAGGRGLGGEPPGASSGGERLAGAAINPLPAGVSLRCDDPAVPADGRNLIAKAVAALIAASPAAADRLGGGLSIDLEKRIPSGGGLGGGSADAAATLVGLDRLWHLGLPTAALADLAAAVGSDVPVFVHALHGAGPGSYFCEGRGERITPLPPPSARWAVLLLPDLSVSTAAAYRRFDDLAPHADVPAPPAAPPRLRDRPMSEWSTLPARDLLAALENDLEPPAFALAPALADLRRAAEDRLNRPFRMSGSGSTLFTLYDGRDEAEAAAVACDQLLGARAVAVALCPTQINSEGKKGNVQLLE